jgi:alpha-beta hydrolase superfamily lysophospholipase
MLVDLVQTTTRDGVRLDGALQAPAAGTPPFPVDAFCLIHGTGGSFYSSTLLDGIAGRLLERGCAVLRVNTRGHDGISTAATAQGGRRQGAAYEVVDDCRHDLAAWIDWLKARAGPRVGLVGHSLGAVKALYALAREPALGAACVVALSPPRLSYSWFSSSPQGPEFLRCFEQAEQLHRDGRTSALLEVTLPLPMVIAAGGYVEKYGPDERYNYLRFVTAVPCPVLLTLGSVEEETNMAFRRASEALRELAAGQPRLAVETIAGADHFYSAVRQELIARIESWLSGIS